MRSVGGELRLSALTYSDVIEKLMAAFPELGEAYRKWIDSWGGEEPGPYNTWGELFSPFFRGLLRSERDSGTLKRIFAFFEEMAGSGDIQVVNLLQVDELEYLTGMPGLLSRAWSYMGEKTKSLTRETAKIWKCEQNLPKAG